MDGSQVDLINLINDQLIDSHIDRLTWNTVIYLWRSINWSDWSDWSDQLEARPCLFIQILSRFCPDFIQVLSRFNLDQKTWTGLKLIWSIWSIGSINWPPQIYDCVSGQAVNVGVTMYVLSISSLSEVEMVYRPKYLF